MAQSYLLKNLAKLFVSIASVVISRLLADYFQTCGSRIGHHACTSTTAQETPTRGVTSSGRGANPRGTSVWRAGSPQTHAIWLK